MTPDDASAPGGSVAVVTGAARGIGRGIALVLGGAGATVYVVDVESRDHKTSELPGTVEDTAEQLSARGGRGVAVAADHADATAMAMLFDRVGAEHGALDLLVGNAFDGNALPFGPAPFWELSPEHWHNMMDQGVRGHLLAATYAAPLLMARGRALVVLTGYAEPDAEVIAGHLYYDLAMTATSRLAHGIAHELGPHGVTALTISPGFTHTEAIADALEGQIPPGLDSVEYVGRAVRALCEDPDVSRHAGRTLQVGDVAVEYGFRDVGEPSEPP